MKPNIAKLGNTQIATLHNTAVLSYDGTDITLNSGGWRTKTTMRHINQAASDLMLDLSVQRVKGQWLVNFLGDIIPFEDGMILGWEGIRMPVKPTPKTGRAFDL